MDSCLPPQEWAGAAPGQLMTNLLFVSLTQGLAEGRYMVNIYWAKRMHRWEVSGLQRTVRHEAAKEGSLEEVSGT